MQNQTFEFTKEKDDTEVSMISFVALPEFLNSHKKFSFIKTTVSPNRKVVVVEYKL